MMKTRKELSKFSGGSVSDQSIHLLNHDTLNPWCNTKEILSMISINYDTSTCKVCKKESVRRKKL